MISSRFVAAGSPSKAACTSRPAAGGSRADGEKILRQFARARQALALLHRAPGDRAAGALAAVTQAILDLALDLRRQAIDETRLWLKFSRVRSRLPK
jgi:hypothetical protein